ncbi:MAG TPA: serine hydrolase domain-containing protein [Allosphingosinicella sp.]|nr:serine hydrolase domain-containing protein [Allosphingosinicella sp.]
MQRLLLAVALAFAAPSAAPAQPPPPEIAQVLPTVDRIFADWQLDVHAPGLVYGIVANGRLVHVGTRGVQDLVARRPVTADSLFRIASMTKAFTALSILRLRDEGRLSLDAAAETYVPEMRAWRYPVSDWPRIRVRDLLSHSAGFVTDDPWGDRQQPLPEAEFTAILRRGVPFTRAPGTAFEYSNFGYALLGRIVENVSGMPYRTYVETSVLRPLGMDSSGYEVREAPEERRAIGYRWENAAWREEPEMAHGAFGAMGGLQTSANDYARWVAFLLSAWPARDGDETGPARRASVRELAQGLNFPALATRPGRTGAAACRQAAAYGMGMRVAQDCDVGLTLAHGGGYPGYGSYVLLLPEHGIGIFAFSNRTYAGPAAAVWDAAIALHRAGALRGRPLAPSDALASAYAAAGAVYRSGDIAAAGDLLAMNMLMDRSRENWRAELRRLRGETGQCDTGAPINPTGDLSGAFSWRCEHGRLEGQLLLAPTDPPRIQALRLSIP